MIYIEMMMIYRVMILIVSGVGSGLIIIALAITPRESNE